MSIGVYGVYLFHNDNIDVQHKDKLAFEISRKATEHGIWINQGGNITKNADYFLEKVHKKSSREMSFQLTDSPMDTTAQCLFNGDGIKVYFFDKRVDTGESLLSRMRRVEQFITSIFDENIISKIAMYVNLEAGDEFQEIEIKTEEFALKMLQLYEKEDNWTPSIKLVIHEK